MFYCFCTYRHFAQVCVDSAHLNWHQLSRQVTYQHLSMVSAMCQCVLHFTSIIGQIRICACLEILALGSVTFSDASAFALICMHPLLLYNPLNNVLRSCYADSI